MEITCRRIEKKRLEYTRARNRAKTLLRKAKRKFEKGIASQSKINPKLFWAYTRSKMKTKTGIAPLLSNPKDEDSLKFDDEEKANILQDQFSSVFTKECEKEIPLFRSRTTYRINTIYATRETVLKELKDLKINKSFGPDEIHPKMLLELAEQLAEPLALLFNMSLQDNILPEDWKKAYITPIFKKGARNQAVNYRPISLTSIVCKVMEKLVRRGIMDHLLSRGLLSAKQHGFINGRCTTTQLLSYLDECAGCIVNVT